MCMLNFSRNYQPVFQIAILKNNNNISKLEMMICLVKRYSRTLLHEGSWYNQSKYPSVIFIKNARSSHVLWPQYFHFLECIQKKQSEKNVKINVVKSKNTVFVNRISEIY